MKRFTRSLALLLIGSHLTTSALAATIIPCGTTEPELLLSKFSFNSTTDFAEITVMNDGNNGNGATLNGWKLGTIDSTLKTFSNFPIQTGNTFTLNDIGNLTSTTDQLVLANDKGEIKDATCWVSSTPTVQETADFTKLADQWSKDIKSCLPSTGLQKEMVFARDEQKDTNQASDWKKVSKELAPTVQENPVTPETPSPILSAAPIATNEVLINEFLPDPEGSDDNAEWIELKNTSDHEVSLQGWQLDDEEGGSKPYVFKNETIGAESFITMSNTVTHITLNNTKDAARLISPTGAVTSSYLYTKVETGKSWARMKNNTWTLTSDTAPGEENSPPSLENEQDATPPISDKTSVSLPDASTITPSSVAVSEIFPNPTGTDKGNEWIEIHNSTSTNLDLSGWKILNTTGKGFTFPPGTHLSAQGYLILTDQITKISLKNSGDQVQILDPDGSVQDTRTFENAPENVSFAKISTVGMEDGANTATTTKSPQISQTANPISWLVAIPTADAQTLAPSAPIPTEEDSTWEWTDQITKGTPNPTYYKIKGTVMETPNENNTFTIEHAGKNTIVQFDPAKTHLDILKAALTKGTNIDITVIEKKGILMLENYKTIDTATVETSSPMMGLVVISLLIIFFGIGIFFYLRRKTLFKTEEILATAHDSAPSASDDTLAHKSPPTPLAW